MVLPWLWSGVIFIVKNNYREIDSDWNNEFRRDFLRLLLKKKIINDYINLENLHEHIDDDLKAYDFNSGVNKFNELFYETDDKFNNLYFKFIKFLYDDVFDFDFYFQSIPTIRIHFPNSKNSNHYPRYHTDCQYGHPPQEINLWFSLTTNDDSGFSLLSLKDSTDIIDEAQDWESLTKLAINDKEFNDYCDKVSKNIKSTTDKIYAFNSLCLHSNHPRKNDTRISMDIRINPVDKFVDGYVGKGRMKAEFKPGGKFGYHLLSSKKI